MSEQKIFELGPTQLSCGVLGPSLQLAYKAYGRLNAEKSNLIRHPTVPSIQTSTG